MFEILADLSPTTLALACAVAVLAGLVKGLVGFAMPMVLISGLSTVIVPELALAGLILPTLVTNGMQALRQGGSSAWQSILKFRAFLLIGLVMLLFSAQLVRVLPQGTLLLLIGIPIAGFAILQLLGWQLKLSGRDRRLEIGVGAFAGLVGGFSGVWGPPTVAYLTALNTEKTEQMRVQGVIYGLGAAALFIAHIGSGVVTSYTLPFSAVLIIPAVLGMWVGGKLQDKIDQVRFRQATLVVLVVAGFNLIIRGMT